LRFTDDEFINGVPKAGSSHSLYFLALLVMRTAIHFGGAAGKHWAQFIHHMLRRVDHFIRLIFAIYRKLTKITDAGQERNFCLIKKHPDE
jgi:hypothetical protein